MSGDAFKFLTAIGQALATATLYTPGHPARERSVDQAYEALNRLLETDPKPRFSFLDGDVVYGPQVLRQLKGWDWGDRLAKVQVQRMEFQAPVPREEFGEFLLDLCQRLAQQAIDTAEVRQMREGSIKYGPIVVKTGEEASLLSSGAATATISYALDEEIETINWLHEQVQQTDSLPLLEAEAVVRSLAVAMHSQGQMFMPLLQLKEFDQYTTTHSSNVAVLAMALGEHLELGSGLVRSLGTAGLMHDLGKVRIPHDILVKPGAFSDSEREVMRRHPVDGARLLLERQKGMELAAVVAYEHHIMLNGEGYPPLHFGRECHYASKLVHVCDVYDALCTNRPYREAWSSEIALSYLEEKATVEFDPEIVTAFCAMMRENSHQRVIIGSNGGAKPAA
jgi:HD-GYP domain-containing protein (c-di-GMP phosphodiesterase class II)